jgi:Tfp pilus assembly protein PilN
MFTIDLLKGQCTPRKSSPGSIATAATAAFVPVVIAMAMFGFYLLNRIFISVQTSAIANYETKISKMSDAVKQQKALEGQIKTYNDCLSEVASNLDRHVQWSQALVTLIKNMPDSVILKSLDVKQQSKRIKVPQKGDPAKMIDASIPVRSLQMMVAGLPESNCDEAIRNYSEQLRSSSVLGPKLENIRVSQGVAKLEDKEVVTYQIDCIFKPGM